MLTFDEDKINSRTEEILDREAEELARYLSTKYNVPYVDLSLVTINPEALALIKEDKAKVAKVAGFRLRGKSVDVASLSPTASATVKILDKLKSSGYSPNLFIASEKGLGRAWRYYEDISDVERTKGGQIDISAERIEELLNEGHKVADTREAVEKLTSSGSQATSMLEVIIAGAISAKASDIHIESREETVRIRYRIDGILNDLSVISPHAYKLLESRIKLLSALKLNIGNKRQDGRFSVHAGSLNVDIRTSVIPGANGESIVMRLLDQNAVAELNLDALGMNERILVAVKKAIGKPNGMVLTTGPTGSGKTTSLYTFIREINNSSIKIVTIEDPIEYSMEGVVQTNIDNEKGYTFLEGLKSAMRQDPDVVMIGEIRDDETARTAVDAALTGHLVFSTLHTNNAAGTIPRLLDLMVNPKVIGSALSLSLAQRLIRTLCAECKTTQPITKEERQVIVDSVARLTELGYTKYSCPEDLPAPSQNGCNACGETGYTGRLGVYEGIIIDHNVEAVISLNPSEHEVWEAAKEQMIPTMWLDGIMKVLDGRSSLAELQRVVSMDS